MADIYVGIAIVWTLALGLFVLALRIGKAASARVAMLLAVLAVGAVVLHSLVLLDNLRLAWLLPLSSLVVVGNSSPLAVGFLAGLAWRRGPRPVWRRCLVVVPLVAVCAYYAYWWLPDEPPKCGDVWSEGVSIQTSPASCSAACAATLLRAHGIETTEREMAELCLTRDWGTTSLGLYRGLKLKTAGTDWDVQVVSWSVERLRQKPPGPVILLVRLDRGTAADPRYERDWGWVPGVTHAVVLFAFVEDDLVEMGDPSVGRERWHVESLDVLWHGLALRLVER